MEYNATKNSHYDLQNLNLIKPNLNLPQSDHRKVYLPFNLTQNHQHTAYLPYDKIRSIAKDK
jgi:hypothetical protein